MVELAKITVSNGTDFIKISPRELVEARRDGFYRPAERGRTIVGSGVDLKEISLAELPAAQAGGFHDLLSSERKALAGNVVKRSSLVPSQAIAAKLGPVAAVSVASSVPLGSAANPDPKRVYLVSAVAGPPSIAQPSRPVQASSLAVELLSELNEAEQEVAEQQRLTQEELDQAKGWRWYLLATRIWVMCRKTSLVNAFQSHSVSILVHVAALLILASLMLKTDDEPKGVILNATPSIDAVVQEVMLKTEPLEITEPTESEESEAPPEAEEIEVEVTEAIVTPNFLAAVKGTAVEKPAVPSPDPGMGEELPKGKPTFFNSRSEAIDYCFVIDNSNSMTKGRFETALHELLLAVNRLTPKQRFYVIFYSDTAYPLFHPYKIPDLVPANRLNKMRLFNWLKTIQLCLKTNGKEAIQLALDLDPDIVFVLGDGAFTDRASIHFAKLAQKKIPIHTLGMEVSTKNAKQFELLATSSGGTYRDVGVNPLGAQMASQYPRKKNNTRTQYWGITLPVKK